MFDYEWAVAQHHLNCRLANRVLVPDAIPAERLARYGVKPPKLVRYPGLKEEYYLADFEPDPAVLDALGVSRTRSSRSSAPRPRTRPTSAAPRARSLPRVLERLAADERTQTVVLARTAGAARGDPRARPPARRRPRARRRRAHARRLRRPARLGRRDDEPRGGRARDARLVGLRGPARRGRRAARGRGRLRFLHDPEQLEIAKKPEGAWRDRVRRDPRDLLRLALLWLVSAPHARDPTPRYAAATRPARRQRARRARAPRARSPRSAG